MTTKSTPLLLVLIFAFLTFSCNNDDDSSSVASDNTIVDFVIENQNYSSLKMALEKTDLTSVLSGNEDYTVFAPDNAAFSAFLTANNFGSLDDVPTDVLKQVLLNHVVDGTAKSSDLSTGYIKTLAEEATTNNQLNMFVDLSSGVLINGDVTVVSADNMVDNGVIHAVNKVIDLPTVVTFAIADNTFSTLVDALTRESSFSYVATLSTKGSPAPFTVFAPTNTAFGSLLTELNMNSLNDIPTATLEATLNSHVVAGNNVLSSALTDGMMVSTLGDSFTINLSNGATFTDNNNRVGEIIVTDVQAVNGVIHVVNKVILPAL